ncbi:MAG TPA: CBS domain-containing protein [Chloroflexus aurantiacus]|jgi:acetoin utilization protein AcuB|uniref:CBS domain containing protein n=1 Tax=Chloroflexus aurantiacus (strain ATCC 29366 / DSM 635 / J-10-fl) TaxID=324602 RepID=A9WKI5_CHLAA|nr:MULTISPECIES: CBS domain-containing protein [Chloroflexus]ABY36613.1 CBS domain containing protein [Chloroflexus aurantiacus J-10-fl]RMG50946.1 MAG: CBS domain-containing protein [Chloroflexota bacterium]HBW68441.1 CBS domain-containing protein [Chloroflexus aurantiacus]
MPKTERVAEWMTENPVTVTPDFSVLAAYERMRARGIRRMPVVDKDGALVGIITRSDIEQAMSHPRSEEERRMARFSLAGQTVAEYMTPNPITVAADASIGEAAAMMIRARVSGLPVMDNGRLIGIITESDIFRLVASTWAAEESG